MIYGNYVGRMMNWVEYGICSGSLARMLQIDLLNRIQPPWRYHIQLFSNYVCERFVGAEPFHVKINYPH